MLPEKRAGECLFKNGRSDTPVYKPHAGRHCRRLRPVKRIRACHPMTLRRSTTSGIFFFCLGLACSAAAQPDAHNTDQPLVSHPKPWAFPTSARDHAAYSHGRPDWITGLQKAGFINRSLPKPYRVAVPLLSFGDAGPKLMVTYTHNLPGNTGSKGVLLFITIPTN
jgi:hypothetical protein